MIKRIAFRVFVALGAALVFALVAGAALTQTGSGRQLLAGLIGSLASQEDFSLRVQDLDGIFSGALRVGDVRISDRQGDWLAVEDIALDWSPARLLTGEFSVRKLVVGKLRLIRIPEPAPKRTGQSGSGELPVSVYLQEFAIHRIEISESVAGSDFDLRAVGRASLQADPLQIILDTRIERDDDVAGSARAVVDFAPQDGRLDLDIAVREPAGGALAGLLRLPGSPSVNFLVAGSGKLENWSADLALDLDEKRMLSGNAAIVATDSELSASLEAQGDIGELLPSRYGPVFAGITRLVLDGRRTSDGGIRLERADLESDMLSVRARGDVDITGRRVDLSGQGGLSAKAGWIALDDADPALEILAPSATFEARGDMRDAEWRWSLDLDGLRSVQGSAGRISVKGSGTGADFQIMRTPFAVEATIGDLASSQPQAARLLDGRLDLTLSGLIEGDMVRVDQAGLKGAGLSLAGSARIDRVTSTYDADFEATARWPLDAESFPALVEDRIIMAGSMARKSEGITELRDIKVSSAVLDMIVNGQFGAETVVASVSGRVADLMMINKDISGAVDFDLSAKGAFSAPELEVDARGSDIALRGKSLEKPVLKMNAVASRKTPSGRLSLTALFAGEPLTGSAALETGEDGLRRIDDLRFQYAGTELNGGLAFGSNGIPVGRLILNAPDLSLIAPLLLVDMSGSINGEAVLTDEGGVSNIIASANAPQVRYGDLSIEDAGISAKLADALGAVTAEGRVTVRSVDAAGTDISDIVINVRQPSGDDPQLSTLQTPASGAAAFDITAIAAGAPMEIAGQVAYAPDLVAIRLDRANAQYRGIKSRLAQPAEIRLSEGVVRIGEAELDIAGGRLRLAGSAGAELAVDARLTNIPMTLIDAVAPGTGAGGSLSGTVSVQGASADPVVTYDLAWAEAGVSATRSAGLPPLSLSASGQFQSQQTKFSTLVGGYPGLSVSAEGTASFVGDRALKIVVTGTMPFALLDRQLSDLGMRLTGAGNIDVDISGPMARPAVTGTFMTSGATFIESNTSIVIRQLDLKAGLSRDLVTIESASGTLSGGGALSAGGTIEIGPGSGFPADLTLKISDGRYADGQLVSTQFNADLSVKGPLQGAATIGGSIVLDRVDITIPERLPRSIDSLSVQHRNAPEAIVKQNNAISPRQKTSTRTGDGPGMQLDIVIDAARQIFVRGRGMDAELGGSLVLKGPVATPVASSGFAMRRGRLNILTQRFDFSRGSIGFSGSLDPELDFLADTQVDGTTITVAVTGKASNPQIGLSSSPSLPDEEILSLLLFDRGLAEMTPFQAAQLANAVATLGGIGGSYGIVDRVRDSLGLSDLDITSDADGNTKVGIGRQIGDKLYLGVEQGLGKDSSRVRIDIDIGKNLKARGEVGADGKSKGGLYYERNY